MPLAAQQPAPDVVESARRIVATIQLAAQEYRLAFDGPRLVNTAEWEEARLFIAEARRAAQRLPAGVGPEVLARLALAASLAERRERPDTIASLAASLERSLAAALGTSLDDRAGRPPSLRDGARLYAVNCAGCHGALARGDGPAAAGLDPRPADLGDPALLATATPLDFYRRITHGVPATAMPRFSEALTREQRWDVVAYLFALQNQIARQAGNGELALVFGTVRGRLGAARELAEAGDRQDGAAAVLEAYMAFEAVEGALGATHPGLRSRAERLFFELRDAIAAGRPDPERGARYASLHDALTDAERALVERRSPVGLFAESLLLMLREGFEAILVIGAIMAVLLKAGASRRRRHVRWGIAAAIAASLVTAALIEWIFRITPAQQEALEGGVMLLAAAVLFYVSYWLISKVEIAAWTRFVKGRIQRAVASGSGLALAGVAFLAVYREGFETVLFYKALFVTAGGAAAGTGAIGGGMALGLALLVATYVGIERFGLRIPMRPFFAVTGATLAYMAFVFAGNGVRELQEGGFIGSTPIAGAPTSSFLGIYPTAQTLTVQGIILLAILGALVFTFAIQPRRLAARVETPAAARREETVEEEPATV